MMGLIFRVWSQLRSWDAAAKWALLLAVILLVALLAVAAQTAGEIRNIILFGFALLVLVTQGVILWGNRHLVTPYTQAQRLAAAGDFSAARDLLLSHLADLEKTGRRPSAKVLTLLGNTYRSLGNLAESEKILRQAVALQPSDYFPLYGLGRTLLVQGHFDESLTFIQKSLVHGAPPGVQCDSGLIHYWRGDAAAAVTAFEQMLTAAPPEPQRRLMAQFLLYHIKNSPEDAPPNHQLMMAGLSFWEAEAQRYALTPYGQALQPILDTLHTLEPISKIATPAKMEA